MTIFFFVILPRRLMCLFEHFRAVMELTILHNADIKETISVRIFFPLIFKCNGILFLGEGSNANKVKRNNRKMD